MFFVAIIVCVKKEDIFKKIDSLQYIPIKMDFPNLKIKDIQEPPRNCLEDIEIILKQSQNYLTSLGVIGIDVCNILDNNNKEYFNEEDIFEL